MSSKVYYSPVGQPKQCLRPSCDVVFQCTTKNKTKKYCSVKCVNLNAKDKTPWNKGIHTGIKTKGTTGMKFSNEVRKKVSNSLIGNKRATGNKNRLGKLHSDETKQKISVRLQGHIPWNKGGKMPPFSETWKQKQSQRVGENSPNWKGGVTPEAHKLRTSLKYKLWREEVFARDNYTCQICDKRGNGDLHADHIQRFADYPELRFDLDNGRTLCVPCHYEVTFGKPMEPDKIKWGRIKE